MSAVITYAGATTPITPFDVTRYETGRTPGNVTHPIAGRAEDDVTLAPASLRAGTLWLVFESASAAMAAENVHALPVAFTLVDAESPTLNMFYIVHGGELQRRFETALDDGRALWLVGVPFREIMP